MQHALNLFNWLYRNFVYIPVRSFQEWRCKRAKAYLIRHDNDYRRQYSGLEIVRRRSKMYDRGVSPIDPSIPDILTLEDEMPRMAWPQHKTPFN